MGGVPASGDYLTRLNRRRPAQRTMRGIGYAEEPTPGVSATTTDTDPGWFPWIPSFENPLLPPEPAPEPPPTEPQDTPHYTLGENSLPPEVVSQYMAKLRTMGYTAPDTGDVSDPRVPEHVKYFQDAYNTPGAYCAHTYSPNNQGTLDIETMNAIDDALVCFQQAVVEEKKYEQEYPITPGPSPAPAPAPAPGPTPNIVPVVDAKVDDSMKKYLLYGGAAVAVLIVGALLLSGGSKTENPRRRRRRNPRRRRRAKGRR